ncbi:hypothetical protein [Kangiella shandongensis]|uniref:hypothetical protein n=1 Tax=Kangiella shandongensis TaxID=2763258 RepID=UPI001CBCDD64|nr:hypothetical protein [Kangiella shandongensis]
MLKKLLIIASLTFGIFSCSSNNSDQMKNLDVEQLNQELLTLQSTTPPTYSLPGLLEQLNFIKPSSQELTLSISKDKKKNSYLVSITNLNVPGDDSISSYKYLFTIKNNQSGKLIFTEAQESWSCWPDRGHQDFSTEKCQ